jgi:hypothetical protein
MNYQSTKNENGDFRFSNKINELQPSFLATHPFAARTSALIGASLAILFYID